MTYKLAWIIGDEIKLDDGEVQKARSKISTNQIGPSPDGTNSVERKGQILTTDLCRQ